MVRGGEFRVAQYSQWDGYPTGQGQTIVDFLLNGVEIKEGSKNLVRYDPVKFREQIDRVRHLTEDQADVAYKQKKFEHLTRNAGALILPMVQEMDDPNVYLAINFAADSLFCEWAYVLDLDADCLEVYKGFNRSPIDETERFHFLQKSGGVDGYYPVRLVRKYRLDELTPTSMAELDAEINGSEED